VRAVQIIEPGHIERVELEPPIPSPGQLLVAVRACGVCRTDLHLLDGEVAIPRPPIVPGHQIVGTILAAGDPLDQDGPLAQGARVGVPWLGWTCGECRYCRSGRENLCDFARFTGCDIDGGFAELAVVDRRFCLELPESYGDVEVAPLLCAGLIGYRALRLAGDGRRLGLYGFGASAHIVAQVARAEGRTVFAFTRPGDTRTQQFALGVGADWAGGSLDRPPEELDCAIIFAAVGELVPAALAAVGKGGIVVCAGIHMSDIPAFPYELLWGERVVRSVANLTRADGRDFFAVAARTPIHTDVTRYDLDDAARALEDLRHGRFEGAAVIDLVETVQAAPAV
jgi:propanol-preferring alcohol dehydrogenase